LRAAPAAQVGFSLVSSPVERAPLFRYAGALEPMAKKGTRSKTGGTKKPYVAPNWIAGKPTVASWTTTGVIAGGWAALWLDGDVTKSTVQAPAGTGDVTDFRFSQSTNPQLTASIAYDLAITERHNLHLRWTPFEIREVDTTTEDIRLEDTRSVARVAPWTEPHRSRAADAG
jgi:hypothetical protein